MPPLRPLARTFPVALGGGSSSAAARSTPVLAGLRTFPAGTSLAQAKQSVLAPPHQQQQQQLLLRPRAAAAASFSTSARASSAGGGGAEHESPYEPPAGWLFGVKPGEKYEREGWERIWVWGYWGPLVLAAVAYAYKPDTSIQTWALEEARRRLEAEGILPDPATAGNPAKSD